jgi:thiamine kinase-like enzyme
MPKILSSNKIEIIEQYLREKKVVSEVFSVSRLKGGILNEVFLVKSDKGDLVYKKHLPYSHAFPEMKLPLGRYQNEKNAYNLLDKILNNKINPKLFLADDENEILVLEFLGEDNRIDKIIDQVDPEIFISVGKTLAEISNKTYKNQELAEVFGNHDFQELKYKFRYYELIGNDKEIFPVRDKIMKEMRENRVAFMHGDPRFNNMIIRDGQFYFFDYEGAFCADLPLDITYLLSEIFIHYFDTSTEHFKKMAQNLWRGYMNKLSLPVDMDHLEYKMVKHLGFALWDKIEGVVKDEYDFVKNRKKIKKISRHLIIDESLKKFEQLFYLL